MPKNIDCVSEQRLYPAIGDASDLWEDKNHLEQIESSEASTDWSYRFKFVQEGCSSVTVAGEFNKWDMKGLAMTRVDGSTKEWEATYKFEAKLAGTKTQFKFVVDGHRWQATPDIPLEDDGHGNINNVITIGIDDKPEGEADVVKELTNLEVPRMLLNRAHKVCTEKSAEIFMHS